MHLRRTSMSTRPTRVVRTLSQLDGVVASTQYALDESGSPGRANVRKAVRISVGSFGRGSGLLSTICSVSCSLSG